jgi:hypothetical protein
MRLSYSSLSRFTPQSCFDDNAGKKTHYENSEYSLFMIVVIRKLTKPGARPPHPARPG